MVAGNGNGGRPLEVAEDGYGDGLATVEIAGNGGRRG